MTQAEQLAAFVESASCEALPEPARQQLKIRILDALGCAIGALDVELVGLLKQQIEEFGGARHCTLVGGGKTAPDRAAFFNSALVRYLDFNDSYLARGETCHPSDNLGAVLAAAEYAGASGRDLMTALAVAYQVQCRLSEAAPVRSRGFDHTTQGSYALAAGISKALGLNQARTAQAVSICGTAFNSLRVSRTGALSNWKGLAYPNTAFCCLHATFLAKRGITGPLQVFEGNKGFMDAIAGRFELNWAEESLDRVGRTILKKYDAEIHSQSTLEAVLELRQAHALGAEDVDRVEVETFDVAYNIIGGGEEGDKRIVRTKEEADHSLPYLVAVALLDGQVTPEQYRPERIRHQDVQELLKKVRVRPAEEYSREFPEQMPCRVTIILRDGTQLVKEKRDYEGFHTRPLPWTKVVSKFEHLSTLHASPSLRREIIDAVANLETVRVRDLAGLLAGIGVGPA
jgi:2-methylcitrate dehydratase